MKRAALPAGFGSLWLAVDYFVTSADDRAMRMRRRTPPS